MLTMKKVMLIIILVFIGWSISLAQKLEASAVPGPVKESLEKKYPKASDIKWEKEKGKYEAEFKSEGKSMSALFESDGKLTESEIGIKVSELPTTAMQYLKDHYKGKTIKEAAKVTKANGEITYEAEIEGKDIVFDSNGKYIKEESE
jgi:hypothetical protein